METLQQELSSSAYLVKKAQLEIGSHHLSTLIHIPTEREKELARLKKEEEAKRLERLWNENQRNLIQKQKDREKKNELDRYQQILTRCSPDPSNRKYVKELDEKFQREEERRKAEVAKKASTNSTDRSAFLLAQVGRDCLLLRRWCCMTDCWHRVWSKNQDENKMNCYQQLFILKMH